MAHGLQLRERALDFIKDGGTAVDAARIFKVTTRTIYNWQHRKSLAPKVHGLRRRKLDKMKLLQHVQQNPDATLRERAAHFGVTVNAIWVAKKRLRIVKKTAAVHRKMSYEKDGVSA